MTGAALADAAAASRALPQQAFAAHLWSAHRRAFVVAATLTVLAALSQVALAIVVLTALADAGIQARLTAAWPWVLCGLGAAMGLKVAATATASSLGEDLAEAMRRRLVVRAADTGLAAIRSIGAARLRFALASEPLAVAAGAWALSTGVQATALLAGTLVYLLSVAFEATLPALLILTIGLLACAAMDPDVNRALDLTDAAETKLSRRMARLFPAAKDLRIDGRRRRDHDRAGVAPARRGARRLRQASARPIAWQTALFLITFDAIVGSAFALPHLTDTGTAAMVLGTTLLALDRMHFTISNWRLVGEAGEAARRLGEIEAALPAEAAGLGRHQPFTSLQLRNLRYRYPGAEPGRDALGPVDLEIRAGEITLIRGGNGAGKSTLMRLICGLLDPTGGRVLVDGRQIAAEDLRAHFASVFTDFHLFRRLHGIPGEMVAEVRTWLDRLDLSGRVRLGADGRFEMSALSTGQRKRLALAVAVAERRPILMLDEWTADQAPEFRQTFFTELLPEFRAAGKTVIAVTHDERYFDACDLGVRLEAGRIVGTIRPGARAGR